MPTWFWLASTFKSDPNLIPAFIPAYSCLNNHMILCHFGRKKKKNWNGVTWSVQCKSSLKAHSHWAIQEWVCGRECELHRRQSHMAFLWLDFDRLFNPSSDIFNIFIDIYYLLILLLPLCTELLGGRGVKHNLVFMWRIKMTIQGSSHLSIRTVPIRVWPPNPYRLEEVNFGAVQLFEHEYEHGNTTWT